jgi:plastocyanin
MPCVTGLRLRLFCCLSAPLWLGLVSGPAVAGDVRGNIFITKGLTKKKVTLPVYQGRGPALPYAPAEPVSSVVEELNRVVVYLEGADIALPTPAHAELSQSKREFVPAMAVVTTGSSVSFPNADVVFHNVFSLSKPKQFDLGRYPVGETRSVRFDKPGIVKVYCHLHPNMAATIVVVPSDWYARPDQAGAFRIEGVPEGEYTVVAWHASVGFSRKRIKVPATEPARVDFTLPLQVEK